MQTVGRIIWRRNPAETNALQPTEGSIATRVEPKQLEERLAIDAHVVYETIHREGEEEKRRGGEEEKRRRGTASHGFSMGMVRIAGGTLDWDFLLRKAF
ncbi:MAG TPA: hypothetical protein VN901_31435 [Candidatus Acidoferrales bacterium]|nr:hypothetical protein [Candidatus Acidoferrales bacterium]